MEDLTNIDEILEYLATIGISYQYHGDNKIHLKSDYDYCDENYNIDDVIRNYKSIYTLHENFKLLDDLFVNCTIHGKYRECADKSYICFWSRYSKITLDINDREYISFDDINDLITYMHENHPEHIKPVDIKIALK